MYTQSRLIFNVVYEDRLATTEVLQITHHIGLAAHFNSGKTNTQMQTEEVAPAQCNTVHTLY